MASAALPADVEERNGDGDDATEVLINQVLAMCRVTPRAHQLAGLRWAAARTGGILADACGLGKTLQGLLVALLWHQQTQRPVLIAVPNTAVADVWCQQAMQFFQLKLSRYDGATRFQHTFPAERPPIVIVQHGTLRSDYQIHSPWFSHPVSHAQVHAGHGVGPDPPARLQGEVAEGGKRERMDAALVKLHERRSRAEREGKRSLLFGFAWGGLVVDEAHEAREDGHALSCAADIRKQLLAALFHLRPAHTLLLTATPFNNTTDGVISLLFLCSRGAITADTFTPEMLAQWVLRRTTSTVGIQGPPPLTAKALALIPSLHEEEAFQRVERTLCQGITALTEGEGGEEGRSQFRMYSAIFAQITLYRQIATHYCLGVADADVHDLVTYPLSAKEQRLVEVVRISLDTQRGPVVVGTEYQLSAERVRAVVQAYGFTCDTYHGSRSAADRAAVLQKFLNGQLQVLAITNGAGGMGLNLPNSGVRINLSTGWNPATIEQGNGRSQRLDSTHKRIYVVDLYYRFSIEEYMREHHLQRKTAEARALLGDEALFATAGSRDDRVPALDAQALADLKSYMIGAAANRAVCRNIEQK